MSSNRVCAAKLAPNPVESPCSTDTTKFTVLSELRQSSSYSRHGFRFNEPDIKTKGRLIAARLGYFDADDQQLSKMDMCNNHVHELGEGWSYWSKYCAIPETVSGHKKRNMVTQLTVKQSRALYLQRNVLLKVGSGIDDQTSNANSVELSPVSDDEIVLTQCDEICERFQRLAERPLLLARCELTAD